MGERTKRLLALASAVKVEDIEELPDPYETDDSLDYIPPSWETSDEEDDIYIPRRVQKSRSDVAHTNKKIDPFEFGDDEDANDTSKIGNTDRSLPSTSEICQIWNKHEFEYENNLKDPCVFTKEIITKLLKELKFTPVKDKAKKSDILSNPCLIINKYKKTICKFCESEIVSKHFARHLERNHEEEREVKEILNLKPGNSQRKRLLCLLRNEGNLDEAARGNIRPKKRKIGEDANERDYAICVHCKGFYKRLSLSRHMNKCFTKERKSSVLGKPLTESLIFSACHSKYGDILNKLNVKKEIFTKMLADEITEVAAKDVLIVYYGEDLLKKTKMKRSIYHISNKLRECAKFFIEMKKFGAFDSLVSVLSPENFDATLEAIKSISRYDPIHRTFGAASLALHFRTTLTALCNLAAKLLLRKKLPFRLGNVDKTLTDVERYKNLIETQWATEIGSLALKDLSEKTSIKHKLIPLTEDIIKLINYVESKAAEAFTKIYKLKSYSYNVTHFYRVLVETVLVLTLLHNRRRVGDVQYLELKSCEQQLRKEGTTDQDDFKDSLTESEKILTQNYKKIVSVGKGNRPVAILIPKKLEKYYFLIVKIRSQPWFPTDNIYFFTYPNSSHWINGCSVIRKYASQCHAKYPELLTCNRLRKHIATTTQILNLKENEIDQLAKFMGHTVKTHETFYKLPQDVYQIAKVSKILQILEKGNASEFKNKSLDEIDVDMEKVILEPDHELNAGESLPKIVDCHITDTENESSPPSQASDDALDLKNHKEAKSSEKISPQIKKDGTSTKKGSRQKWLPAQKSHMKKYFSKQIRSKTTLRKKECEDFIEDNRDKFEGVSWSRVKAFVYNLSKSL